MLGGTVNKASGNWYVLSIYKLEALYQLAVMLNGLMRTPKVEALHRLINWFNALEKYPIITPLGLDNSAVSSNYWLAGLLDADGSFGITFLLNSIGIAIDVDLVMRLSQRQLYHLESSLGVSYLAIMTLIADFLNTNLIPYKRQRSGVRVELGYIIRVKSLVSRLALINYLSEYPLMSGKRMDYNSWLEAHYLVTDKLHKTPRGTAKLTALKSGMNTGRTTFDWSHLGDYK
uniref:Homing endonuclease LAGLIDADG domain-containing protein n=1 Tax=Tremella fuciformis TaxID=64657 RepID=A0A2H4QC00_9TREE|nr:hypothetical protein [Tremella fuciformis]